MKDLPTIVGFKEVGKEDIHLVGGKGANLGELASASFPVPPGFILTTAAYKQFLFENRLEAKIYRMLEDLDVENPVRLQQASEKIASLFQKSEIPQTIKKETIAHYRKLGGLFRKALVAVRSSATAEDLPKASFAGQQATFLNIQGEANLFEAIKKCWASLFTARAIFYRMEHKIPHKKVAIAIIVQEMVQGEVSGVAFTVDPVTQEKNIMLVEAIWGLGELIVQGAVMPDRYKVNRRTLEIVLKEVVPQIIELVKIGNETRERKISSSRQKKQKIPDSVIKSLAKILRDIHDHYYFPQDIEWVFQRKKLYIVQTRPVTTLRPFGPQARSGLRAQGKLATSTPILKGIPASPGIATGPVVKINGAKELSKVQKGDVLVTVMTSPDYVPAMRKVAAIITDSGGQTSHASIVSRELGVPCVVGTKNATSFLTNGTIVTVDGSKGLVYRGGYQIRDSQNATPVPSYLSTIPNIKTATKLYVNLAEPEKAREVASRNIDGVGLLRAEFMIANIGVHPKKAIADKKKKDFIQKLTHDLLMFCETFYPRPVVYRATDFKTNEYRNLKGGKAYEPEEPNPLLGYRGAFRYIHDPDSFELELAAIKQVREKGLKNLWLMIPFVRSPKELLEVKKIVTTFGLLRGPTFKLWLMVELPVNVILLPDFIRVGIDGVSVGSNDLTMTLLGTDRDNEEVAPIFDERSPAVLWALQHVIRVCKKFAVTSSICGQAPSVYNDLLENLVQWGITSISVNPDAIERAREVIYNAEGRFTLKS